MKKLFQDEIIAHATALHEDGYIINYKKFGDFDHNSSYVLTTNQDIHPLFASLIGEKAWILRLEVKDGKKTKMVNRLSLFGMARYKYGATNDQLLAFIVGMNNGRMLSYYEKRAEFYFWNLAGITVRRKLFERGVFFAGEEHKPVVEYAVLIMAMSLMLYFILSVA